MKDHIQLEDGTIWPYEDDRQLEWVLRYGSVSDLEKLRFQAAHFVACYYALIGKTNERRNQICNEIKAQADKQLPPAESTPATPQ